VKPRAALRSLGAAARGLRIERRLHVAPGKRSYLAARRSERFVLRVDEPDAPDLGLDRGTEARVLRAVGAAGVGPALVACRLQAPAVFLLRYAPGRAWTAADLDDPRRLAQFAALLREVHAVPTAGLRRLDLAAAAARYARLATRQSRLNRSGVGATPVATLAAQVRALLAEARDPAAPLALCHNDPIAANLVGLRRPLLIDWEYAAVGDPLFDLAVIVEHHRLRARSARCLLAEYFGGTTAIPATRLALFRAIYRRILRLWQLAHDASRDRPLNQGVKAASSAGRESGPEAAGCRGLLTGRPRLSPSRYVINEL
jgi:thiamine kinase